MDIEELSKSQLILLTILVNFVISVATGILTVSLLDHAPPVVTQTVNRVVEHTIEKVAQAAPAAVVQVQAPAPSNQELVTAAISAAAARTVAIFDGKQGTTSPAVAIGTLLPKTRAVVTIARDSLPQKADIEFSDGTLSSAVLSRSAGGLALYTFEGDLVLPKVSAPSILELSELRLGQTALAIGVDGSAATGIVSKVVKDSIRTTLPDIGAGSAAVDLSGNLIGIASGNVAGVLVPAANISLLLAPVATSTAATTSPQAP